MPDALKFEWRSWSLERRREFIARLRVHVRPEGDRPDTPFSRGLEPFEYGSPRAHAIAERLNRGRTSQTKRVAIHVSSQGVIYKGQLYFWSKSSGPAYFIGPWRPGRGRPPLHRLIWEEHHRRKVPKGCVVRHADGNRNNFSPSNLVLATKNDIARENQAAALARKSRAATALLLARQQAGTSDAHIAILQNLRSA